MKKLFVIFIGICLIGAGCGKSYLSSLSNNPNAPTTEQATPQAVLPAALTNLVAIVNDYGSYQPEAVWLGYWNFQAGYSFNSTVADYVMTSSSPQLWDNYYGVLTNLNVTNIVGVRYGLCPEFGVSMARPPCEDRQNVPDGVQAVSWKPESGLVT